jgi:hypothetical protein
LRTQRGDFLRQIEVGGLDAYACCWHGGHISRL